MKKRTAKQIAALIAVVLLAALYIVTLIVAILDNSAAGRWFQACLVCTVAIPLLTWIFIWLYGQMTGKKTIADLHLMRDEKDYEKEMTKRTDMEEADIAEGRDGDESETNPKE